MTRINTNVPALIAVNDLHKNNEKLGETLRRLSSGLKINKAGDDPAGLIISELLRGQIGALKQAVNNSERASNVLATAEGALNEVSTLMITIRGLCIQASNRGALTSEEIRAAQLQVDSAVQSVTRIANSTTFGGTPLLNGNLDYVTSGVGTAVTDLAIHSVQFGTQAYIPVVVEVVSAAQGAGLVYTAAGLTASQNITVEIAGKDGVETLSFIGSTATSAIMFAVNTVSDVTGISAALSGTSLVMTSMEEGSEAFVSVKALAGQFDTSLHEFPASAAQRDTGKDANASINGSQAVSRGNRLTLNTTALSLDMAMAPGYVGTSQFAITGGGALFQLGQSISTSEQINIGLRSVAAGRLGRPDIGFLSEITTGGRYSLVVGQTRQAMQIIDEAILQVSTLRGRLGAFELNTVETNIASLSVAVENATAAESLIRDADFAEETSNLTRAQILVSAGTSVLSTANTTPQSVLKLLQ
ncbi:MAG: flagellin N-terminal helical domain-containing protein [Planctomycetota bacterium]|jgi:flagellin